MYHPKSAEELEAQIERDQRGNELRLRSVGQALYQALGRPHCLVVHIEVQMGQFKGRYTNIVSEEMVYDPVIGGFVAPTQGAQEVSIVLAG